MWMTSIFIIMLVLQILGHLIRFCHESSLEDGLSIFGIPISGFQIESKSCPRGEYNLIRGILLFSNGEPINSISIKFIKCLACSMVITWWLWHRFLSLAYGIYSAWVSGVRSPCYTWLRGPVCGNFAISCYTTLSRGTPWLPKQLCS